jgi:serine protease Do
MGAVIVAVLALAAAAPARADDAAREEIVRLDARFRAVATRAIPATVLVRSTLKDGSGRAGYGSGAIISPDGYVLTCSHVIDIAGEIEVTLATGEAYPARLLGKNPKQDYALLKIDGHDLPSFPLGDSGKVALGDWVIAIGHPGGPYPDLKPAFSVGRVTGLHRRLPVQMMDRFYDDAIRTDAPIFAGNSGGPLVDLDGRLVGLNGAILLINENSYAVPIDEIRAHLDELKAGALVAGRSGGPGSGIGALDEFQGEDIARFAGRAGRKLFGKDGLGKLFRGRGEMGDDLARALERFGRSLEDEDTQRMLEELAKAFGGGGPERDPGGAAGPGNLLRRLGDLFGEGPPRRSDPAGPGAERSSAPRAFLGVVAAEGEEAAGLRGVLVRDVVAGSPAAGAGIEPGDVLIAVAGKRTAVGEDLGRVLAGRGPGDQVLVRLLRAEVVDGVPIEAEKHLTITLAERPKD